ncbi:MAG: SdpI family protein [Clostridia bacterium]|nr:SdpI family protein [Clostridia bacterium]
MIKKNKWRLIISSIIIMLPCLLGFFGSNLLPETIATHWGVNGTADGFMSSSLAFIILPAILLAIHWICMIISAAIDKNSEQNRKVMEITFWIIPVISLISCGTIFAAALGYTTKLHIFVLAIIAVAFIVIGNYMPKTTRNRTMGIKIRWTLANDENWNATHRFSGKVFVIAGFLSLLSIFLPPKALPFVLIAIIAAGTIIPVVYSYSFYKKQLASGSVTKEEYKKSYDKLMGKKYSIIGSVAAVIILVGVAILMFVGNIETTLGEDALTVKASFGYGATLNYDDITEIEYREDGVDGARTVGFASAKLLLGTFQNDELGTYTRFTTARNCACVVIKANDHVYVIGVNNEATVKEIYERISSEISE